MVACQIPLPMEFSRQEYWSGLLFSPPGNLPDPGIEPKSFVSPALTGRFFTSGSTWEPLLKFHCSENRKARQANIIWHSIIQKQMTALNTS